MLVHPTSPIIVVVWEESRPGASVNTEKVAPVSERKLTVWPPTVINTQSSSGVIRMGDGWRLQDPSSPDCPESPTPETYTSGGSLLQCGPLQMGQGAGGGLDA